MISSLRCLMQPCIHFTKLNVVELSLYSAPYQPELPEILLLLWQTTFIMVPASVPLLLLVLIGTVLAGPGLQLEETRSNRFRQHLIAKEVAAKAKINAEPPEGYLLPTSIAPTDYVVQLRPILYEDDVAAGETLNTAPGYVKIQGVGQNETDEIVIHKHPTLNIDSNTIKVQGPNNENIDVTGTSYNETMHFYTIKLGKKLALDASYVVSMNFTASVSTTRTSGLYRALYTNDNNEEKCMATTQFESAGARAAFPCFDEPALKAKFSISLARPANKTQFTCLANTIIIGNRTEGNWIWFDYQETVRMSTYLLAFVVAEDYDYREAAPTLFDKTTRVYGPAHLLARNSAEFSAEASARTLQHLQDKYQFPYEMPKMDSIAIPRPYFGGGAMENWGLNTYRDDALLFYPGESGESRRQSILSILAHELGHQWFGDLVTCRWWTHIWLNEGFATYVSFYGVQNVSNGEFDYVREMLWDTVQYALDYDVGLDGSVINDKYLPDEIENVFGSLTYDKGGSLVRMMESLLGAETFTAALADYLRTYNYSAVFQDQLFEVLTKHALDAGRIENGTSIKQIMDTWTLQPGYPLVRVSRITPSYIYVSQEKFNTQPHRGESSSSSSNELTMWEIPITIASAGEAQFSNYEPKLWLNHYTLSASHRHEADWLVVNPDGTGFYRVLYDSTLLDQIKSVLANNFTAIGALSRSQLLDDYFNFAKHRYVNIKEALDLTTFLQQEDDHVVWYTVFTDLAKALRMFSNEDLSNFKAYWLPKIESVLTRKGWVQSPEDRGTLVLFRAKLLDWACNALESSTCKTYASDILSQWRQNASAVPLDVQPVYYCAMVAHGGDDAYDLVRERIEDTSEDAVSEFQKTRLLSALPCARDAVVLQNLLERTLTADSPYGKAATTILQGVAVNSVGREIVIDFIRNQFTNLGASAFVSTVSTLSSYLTKESQHDDLQEFIGRHVNDFSSSQRTYLNAYLTNIKKNIEWVEEFYGDMNSWLAEHKP